MVLAVVGVGGGGEGGGGGFIFFPQGLHLKFHRETDD